MSRYRLEEKFQQSEAGSGSGFMRVSATHPVELFVGTEDGHRALLLVCDKEPAEAPSMEAISVHRRKREDGRWAFLVSLERKDLADLFSYLAEDLVLSTEREKDSVRASRCVVERLKWWTRLLSRAKSGVLGDAELRGLVGELLFLRDYAIPALGVSEAVKAWVGPLDAPRDFKCPDCDVEVKAHARDAETMRISSAEQLDTWSAPIVLAAIQLEGSQADVEGAFSVQGLVDGVIALCEPDAERVTALRQRLWAVGYVEIPHYEKIYFRSEPPVFYRCGEDFPKITPRTLPKGVTQCSYQVAFKAIKTFIMSDWRGES